MATEEEIRQEQIRQCIIENTRVCDYWQCDGKVLIKAAGRSIPFCRHVFYKKTNGMMIDEAPYSLGETIVIPDGCPLNK